jgi:hypothetical protein
MAKETCYVSKETYCVVLEWLKSHDILITLYIGPWQIGEASHI